MNPIVANITGNVDLNIYSTETNELIETWNGHNLITASGLVQLVGNFRPNDIEGTRPYIKKVGFATAVVSEPAWGDITESANTYRKDISYYGTSVGATPELGVDVRLLFTLDADEFNGNTLSEMTLWLQAPMFPEQFFMLSRINRAPIVKTSAIRIEGAWTLNFSVVVA